MSKLMLGLPKGSLEQSTVDMFAKAGYKIEISSRSYYPSIDDPDIDCNIILFHLFSIAELVYGKVGRNPLRWVLAVPENSGIHSVKDLEGKRISTEAVGMTKRYLAKNNVNATVEFSWGATEVKPPKLADAIVEITETGSSLRANHLKIIDTLCISTTRFIANKKAYLDPVKKEKIENIALLLKAVLAAEGKVGLLLNAKKADLDKILGKLPALERPTISPLSDSEWVALNTIVSEHVVRELIPDLKHLGASGIVEYPLNKIVE